MLLWLLLVFVVAVAGVVADAVVAGVAGVVAGAVVVAAVAAGC